MRQETTQAVHQIEKIVDVQMRHDIPIVEEFVNRQRNEPKHPVERDARYTWPHAKHGEHEFYRAINRAFASHCFLSLSPSTGIGTMYDSNTSALLSNVLVKGRKLFRR